MPPSQDEFDKPRSRTISVDGASKSGGGATPPRSGTRTPSYGARYGYGQQAAVSPRGAVDLDLDLVADGDQRVLSQKREGLLLNDLINHLSLFPTLWTYTLFRLTRRLRRHWKR